MDREINGQDKWAKRQIDRETIGQREKWKKDK
jgi:hypothetical protein